MKPAIKQIVIATLLTLGSFVAVAQTTAAAIPPNWQPCAQGQQCQRGNPDWRQQRMAQRHADRMAYLKAQLQITPAQEGAWNSFVANMQPPALGNARMGAMQQQRAELDNLPLPERIERMRALRAERQQTMMTAQTQREDALKALYAALTPDQQKTLDAQQRNMRGSMRGQRMMDCPGGGGGGMMMPM